MKLFCAKLRYMRSRYEYTQQNVATGLHIDRSTYAYYETGKTKPDIEQLYKIARIYNVSADYLLNDAISVKRYQKYPFPTPLTSNV